MLDGWECSNGHKEKEKQYVENAVSEENRKVSKNVLYSFIGVFKKVGAFFRMAECHEVVNRFPLSLSFSFSRFPCLPFPPFYP